jgi:hypothetical protein
MNDQQMLAAGHVSSSESFRRTDDERHEYGSACDLSTVLDYTERRTFKSAIVDVRIACEDNNQEPSDHVVGATEMVQLGSGARREIEDVLLSRYACYLIQQNADPSKAIVALGQTSLGMQTHRAEMAAEELAGRTEDQKRLYVRAQMTGHNRLLAAAANDAGVVSSQRRCDLSGSWLHGSLWQPESQGYPSVTHRCQTSKVARRPSARSVASMIVAVTDACGEVMMILTLQHWTRQQVLIGIPLGLLPALIWLLSFWGLIPPQVSIAAVAVGFALYMLFASVIAYSLFHRQSWRLGIGLLAGFVVSTGVLLAGIIYTAAIAANAN